MDVAFATDGRGVAKPCGYLLDGIADVALGAGLAVEFLKFLQGHRGEHGAVPGAEILGGDILAADLAQVSIDVRRRDVAILSLIVDILEELLAGQILARPDDLGDAPVTHA